MGCGGRWCVRTVSGGTDCAETGLASYALGRISGDKQKLAQALHKAAPELAQGRAVLVAIATNLPMLCCFGGSVRLAAEINCAAVGMRCCESLATRATAEIHCSTANLREWLRYIASQWICPFWYSRTCGKIVFPQVNTRAPIFPLHSVVDGCTTAQISCAAVDSGDKWYACITTPPP
jgi:hypothetical protein